MAGNVAGGAGWASPHMIYSCVVGSWAYGLAGPDSDVDNRGIYAAPAGDLWSLAGAPEQVEDRAAGDSTYWEVKRFLTLGLAANPSVLECMWTPFYYNETLWGERIRAERDMFLSRRIYTTYRGYARAQFVRLERRVDNDQPVRWKHAMHLIRLLLAGIEVCAVPRVQVEVSGEHRDRLRAIKAGEVPMAEVLAWSRDLEIELDTAFASTYLPERPDEDRADRLLLAIRRASL